jgi:putative acyl-CoA dehydrogenase
MEIHNPTTRLDTHEVKNQPRPLTDPKLFEGDAALREAVARWAPAHEAHLRAFGERCGSAEVRLWGEQANRVKPTLHTFDRYGQRIDQVELHPAYHALMTLGVEAGLPSVAWRAGAPDGGHLAHAALLYTLTQVEAGVCCPLSMTYAGAPVVAKEPSLRWLWEGLQRPAYDPRLIPPTQKAGLTMGMAMTEKQGGSDVRANETRAEPIAGSPGEYRLTGHKWFCSAPMSDAFLTLAYAPGGLSCFLLPRYTPDGERNALRLMRLKDKLGNHANASSEVEYHGAWARLVGEEGQGVRTIIEMVNHTRLDSALGNAGLMRQALVQAAHHCAGRRAFGALLSQQPLMRRVLADMAIESEAATLMTLRLAHAFDASQRQGGEGASDEGEGAFARLATAITKFWVCKRTPELVYEALECHGGAGYVEEAPMARLYREAPLNSIWEGSGNVICLDVLRALSREPEAAQALAGELELGRGRHRALDAALDRARSHLSPSAPRDPAIARALTSDLAVALQGSLLARYAPEALWVGFCESRLGAPRRVYGEWEGRVDTDGVLRRLEWLLEPPLGALSGR